MPRQLDTENEIKQISASHILFLISTHDTCTTFSLHYPVEKGSGFGGEKSQQ